MIAFNGNTKSEPIPVKNLVSTTTFSNGTIETFSDGTKVTKHNNGTITTNFPWQEVTTNYGNGTIISRSGSNFPGRKEVINVDANNITTNQTTV